MRPRERDLDADALIDEPFFDEAERAESNWLLARGKAPDAPAPSPSIAKVYEEIEDLLETLSVPKQDGHWQEEVLRTASLKAAPWWRQATVRWTLSAAVVAAAAVALISLLPRPPELDIETRRARKVRALEGVMVGDHLVVTARARDGIADVRVYMSDGTLVARCPSGPGCTAASGGSQVIDIELQKPVQHQVIMVVQAGEHVPDLPIGSMASYLEAARTAKARIIVQPPVDVH